MFFWPLIVALPALQDPRTASVRLYPDRARLVDRADELAAKGQWRDVLDIYTEAIEQERDALVPAGNERYLGVSEFCRRRLELAPEGAREEYRRRTDDAAAEALAGARRARDLDALDRLIDAYPFSSCRDEALATRAQWALDDGDADAAVAALEALWETPESRLPRELTAARLAEACRRAGRADALARLRDQVARDEALAARPIRVGARSVPLREYLSGLEAAPAAAAPSDAWAQFGGAPGGYRTATEPPNLSPPCWEDATLPPVDAAVYSGRDAFGGYRYEAPAVGLLFPAVADGTLYIHNEYEVRAYALWTRKPRKLWSFRLAQAGDVLEFNLNAIQSVTLLDGRLFVSLVTRLGRSLVRQGGIPISYPFPTRTLFALDAATGELLWRFGGQIEQEDVLRSASVPLAPTTDGRRLYVGLVQQRHPTDPFRHYVACLDPADGRVHWSTFVASGHTEINLFGNSARESIGSPVAVAGDTVFYVTHHGAAAALDRAGGRLRWVERYPQWEILPTRRLSPVLNAPGWFNRPALLHDGSVFYAPTDSPLLMRRDLKTGAAQGHLRRPFDARALLGIVQGRLLLGGRALYAYATDLAPEPRQLWSTPAAGVAGPLAVGAPLVTPERIYVPTPSGIELFDARDGKRLEAARVRLAAEQEVGPNLTALPDVTILSGRRGLAVCFDEAAVARRVQEIADQPDAPPERLYEAALRSTAQDDPELTLRLLNRARRAAGPADARIHAGAARHLLALLKEQAADQLKRERYAEAIAILEEARRLNPGPVQEIALRRELAEAHWRDGRPDRALELLQELIRDFGERTGGDATVGRAAHDLIEEILREHGRALYEPYEQQAARRLARSVEARDVEEVLATARLYPNSAAAKTSLREALRLVTARGDAARALEMIRTLLNEPAPADPDELAVLAARLVSELERRKLPRVARTVLALMESRLGAARLDGVPVAQFVRGRLGDPLYRTPEPPFPAPLRPPLRRVGPVADAAFAGALPIESDDPTLLFLETARGVTALEAADLSARWTAPMDGPILRAVPIEEVVALASPRLLAGFARADGKRLWTMRLPETRALEARDGVLYVAGADPSDPGTTTVRAVDAASGIELWRTNKPGSPPVRLDLCGPALVLMMRGPPVLYALDRSDGRLLQVGPMRERGGLYEVIAADASGVEILSPEPREGILRWNVGDRVEKWRAQTLYPDGPALRAVGPGHYVLITRGIERGGAPAWMMRCYDRAAAGKLKAFPTVAEARDLLALSVGPTHAVVVAGEQGRAQLARGYALPSLEKAWELPLGAGAELLAPPQAWEPALVLATATPQEGARLSMNLWIVSPSSGQLLQRIEGDRPYERPPLVQRVRNGFVITVEREVQYWTNP
jgi:outer membrane protein assembly factor BamB